MYKDVHDIDDIFSNNESNPNIQQGIIKNKLFHLLSGMLCSQFFKRLYFQLMYNNTL